MCRIFDPCGIFMASLTPIITGTGVYILNKICIFNFFILPEDRQPISHYLNLTPFGILLFYVFNICSALGVISHFRCSMADPGIVPKNIKIPQQIQNQVMMCKKGCKRWKPARAHHCSECKSCIMRMDHHCPWVNNCVGIGNMKYFMLFLAYIGIAATILSVGMIGSFFAFSSKLKISKHSANYKEEQRKFGIAFILGFVGFLIGVIFALFTFQMFKDQSSVIQENQPGVEQLKQCKGTPMFYSDNFVKIFGRDKRWWFLPVNPGVRINYLQKVYTKNQLMEIIKSNSKFEPDPVYNEYDKYEKQRFQKCVLYERLIWIALLAGFFSFVFSDLLI